MTDKEIPIGDSGRHVRQPYTAPSLRVIGTVAEITGGPDPGAGDVPTGVISF